MERDLFVLLARPTGSCDGPGGPRRIRSKRDALMLLTEDRSAAQRPILALARGEQACDRDQEQHAPHCLGSATSSARTRGTWEASRIASISAPPPPPPPVRTH